MFVTPLGPRETINWFEQQDRQHEILCFMITANSKHRHILRELAQNYIDSDVALGSKVAFILFGGGDVNHYPEVDVRVSTRMFLPGESLQPSELRMYANENQFNQNGAQKKATRPHGLQRGDVDTLTTETVKVSAEWMKVMKVKRKLLPALCVLVKGSDPLTISLGNDFDTSQVLRLFGRFADIVERDCEQAMSVTFNAEAKLKRALELGKEIERLEEGFRQHMEALCKHFKATPEERESIAEFLSYTPYVADALDRVLANCKFAAVDRFESHPTIKGARNKLKKLAKAILELKECRPKKATVENLTEAVKRIKNRRNETTRLVEELLEEGVKANALERGSLGVYYDIYAARANQTATLLEKASKLFGLIKSAGLLSQILK